MYTQAQMADFTNFCCIAMMGAACLPVCIRLGFMFLGYSIRERRHQEQLEIDRERNEILRRGVRVKEFEVISRYTDAEDDHSLPRPKKNPWLK